MDPSGGTRDEPGASLWGAGYADHEWRDAPKLSCPAAGIHSDCGDWCYQRKSAQENGRGKKRGDLPPGERNAPGFRDSGIGQAFRWGGDGMEWNGVKDGPVAGLWAADRRGARSQRAYWCYQKGSAGTRLSRVQRRGERPHIGGTFVGNMDTRAVMRQEAMADEGIERLA
jgi:hypothetical protein